MTHRPFLLPGPTDGLVIGLMGGSFDPPHSGHVHVIHTAIEHLRLDWMWVIPARGNPLKNTQTPFAMRIELSRALLSGPRTRVSPIEHELGLTYTIDLIKALKQRAPGARFVWVMGADSLQGFHEWRNWREIARLVPIAIVSRPGAFPRAGLSRFAQQFSANRLSQSAARNLAFSAPPAWVLIKSRLDPTSSTALRTVAAT